MTAELTSLTAKMDALRAKGFSDEEINTLLSPVAVEAQPNLLPLTDGDKAYAEQWNENIEETARTSWKIFFSGLFIMAIMMYPTLAKMDDFFAVPWFFFWFIILAVGIVYTNYKQEQRVKFFLKKRVD
jgi:hypothetical protein